MGQSGTAALSRPADALNDGYEVVYALPAESLNKMRPVAVSIAIFNLVK